MATRGRHSVYNGPSGWQNLFQLSVQIVSASAGRGGHGGVQSVDYSGLILRTAVGVIRTFARFHGIVPAQLSVQVLVQYLRRRDGEGTANSVGYSGLILRTPVCVIRPFGRFHGTVVVPAQTRAVPYRGLFLNNTVQYEQYRCGTIQYAYYSTSTSMEPRGHVVSKERCKESRTGIRSPDRLTHTRHTEKSS